MNPSGFGVSANDMAYEDEEGNIHDAGFTHEFAIQYFKKAFYYNQLVFVFLPFFIFIYLYNTYDYVFERNKPIKIPDKVGILLVVITIAFGIIRNII